MKIKPLGKVPQKSSDTVKTRIRAVLFDLDGVLVNAPAWHKEALDKSLIFHGLAPIGMKDHKEIFNGLSTNKKLEILNQRGIVPRNQFKSINDKKQELTVDIIKNRCKPIKRIRELVFWLYNNGFKPGVVTNCSKRTAQLMLRLSGLTGCWYTTITNDDVDGLIKPDPFPYKLGVKETCGFPELALAIDDSHHGVESAKAAQIKHIWHLEKFTDLTLKNLKERLVSDD